MSVRCERRASFVQLEAGEVLVVGPEEQAEWMLLATAGQLQVYEIALSSGHRIYVKDFDGLRQNARE